MTNQRENQVQAGMEERLTVHSLVNKPFILARVLAFVGPDETTKLVYLDRSWAKELMRPVVWEMLAEVPHHPLLVNCFRRAANYCYREIDVPSPNVNRRGSPPVIRACLLNERTSIQDYVRDLKLMSTEDQVFQSSPTIFDATKLPELKNKSPSHLFSNAKLLSPSTFSRSRDTRLFSGGLQQDLAEFYLWSVDKQKLRASISQSCATCFHACNDALAVGCNDGTVKVWDLHAIDSRITDEGRAQMQVPPTATISHRSSLGMVPFIRTRSREKMTKVHIDHSDGTFLYLAASTEKGEAEVWDVTKGERVISIPTHKLHRSSLPRAQREQHPQISSLMLFRNTLVCGTSSGFIRVFDLRSGRLTHRLAGHPEAVAKTDTKGRVLWSAGEEGSVRWWGGKSAKILPKSALCQGKISALEMDDTVVVAGYSEQGMETWDVRTQQPLSSFSSKLHGGVSSIQFDSRKIVTSSPNGRAAVWRWYAPQPMHWLTPKNAGSVVSARYDDDHVVLGTSDGKLFDYGRLSVA